MHINHPDVFETKYILERNMMDGIREIEARLDNMSIMALKMSHAIGIDVPSLLQTLGEAEELEGFSDVENES